MNLKKLSSRFYQITAVVILTLTGIACTETETTDSTKFAIYYSGMTDIGPSMSSSISAPTYIGSAPSDFSITQVTVDNEPVQVESFIIDSSTGKINIGKTETLAIGIYRLSISCVSGGNTYNFQDAVSINMMRPVPAGIRVEPDSLTIDYAETKTSNAKAQVLTEGEHVSISKYEIANNEYKEYFTITPTGEISINKAYTGDIQPGVYHVSLKLKTGAGEGLFANAVTFNIISKPLGLTYTPAIGKIEEETFNPSSYKSNLPTLKGSTEEAVYSINKITPATDQIQIDSATGMIFVNNGHGLKAGEKYAIDVNVRNKFNTPEEKGTTFEGVFTLEILSFINEIANFKYENTTKTQFALFRFELNSDFVGDEVTFELGTVSDELKKLLVIDSTTGNITVPKGNTLPLGTYTVEVKASNVKSEQITSFQFEVVKNPNSFTYINYGNNLELSEGEAYQYRINSAEELANFVVPAPQTDINPEASVTWTVQSKLNMSNGTVGKNGSLHLKGVVWKDAICGMVMATATVGTGDESISMSVPIFFHFAAPVKGVTINYSPFVCRVNPRLGGQSVAPTITGVDQNLLLMDYRRSFSYININGNESHVTGLLKDDESAKTSFMGQVWRNYYAGINNAKPAYGAKKPLSYYDNKANLASVLGYVNPTDKSIIINPGKWMGEDKEYANGVMSGQTTFVTNGNETGINNGNQTFPILIWFDEKF